MRAGLPTAPTPRVRKAGPGFSRGEAAGHKYWKRVRRLIGGKLRWVYYYNDEKSRNRWAATTATQLEQHHAELHKLKGQLAEDHPELRAKRKALRDLSVEYVTELLTWPKAPKVKIGETCRKQYELAVQELYKGGDAEPDDPMGKHISVMRTMEMAFGRMPPSIQQHFSGAIADLAFSAGSDSENGSGPKSPWAGYCRFGRKDVGSKIVVSMDRSQSLFGAPGMKGGLFPVEVLVHEMGHAIHNRLGAYDDEKPEGWTGPVWKDWEDTVRRIKAAKEPGVTDYAETNPKEWWAESFTAALMYPRELASRSPIAYEFMRKFFGPGAMRPMHTNPDLVAQLEHSKGIALAEHDAKKVEELSRKLDEAVGVLDMPKDDRRLQWWLAKETRIQRAVRMHQETLPKHPDFWRDDPPSMDTTGDKSHDRFYEVNVKGRTVYMRYGAPTPGAEHKGWDPESADGRTVKPNPAEIKEVFDTDGQPLDTDTAWWFLHQDELPDEHPDVEGFAGFGTEERKEENTAKKIKARKLSEMLLQMTRASYDPKQPDAGERRPVEITMREYRQRSGTFTHDQWGAAGHREIEQLRTETDPGRRDQLIADLRKKQPGVRMVQPRDARGRLQKPQVLMGPARSPGEQPVPQLGTIRYVNDNPDGTKTVVEVVQDDSGDVSRSGRYYVDNPMWRALLTPDGQDVRSPEHLEQLCRQAAQDRRRAWVSIKTDARDGDTEHFFHVQVEFDGRGQPKVLGSEWKRRTGKDVPRLDDILSESRGAVETSRPTIAAETIKLEKQPATPRRLLDRVPKKNDRVVLSAGGPELRRKEGHDVVVRLDRIIPGKAKGVVPDPPGWDRMPDTETPTLPGGPGELAGAAKLTPRERSLRKRGLLPGWYVGRSDQREWLTAHFEPAFAKYEATKDEATDQEFPEQYVFVGEVGGGAAGKRFVRYGAKDAAKSTRRPQTARKPRPLQSSILLYAHTRVDPVDGTVIDREPRVLLPADGSVTADQFRGLPGITVAPDSETGQMAISVNMAGFARLRDLLGHVSMTGDAEELLRARVDHLREIAEAAKKRTHVIELDEIDPAKLAAKGVGLKPVLPDGNAFVMADHQQGGIQLVEDNGGRGLLGHYMGCVSGDTVINVNRGGKGFPVRIADAFERTESGQWDPEIGTRARSLVADGKIGLADVAKVWDSGEKTTYRMALEDGRTNRTTAEHLFLTLRGWVRHDALATSDEVAVELAPVEPGGRAPKRAYRVRTNLYHHPHARGQGRSAMRFYVLTHRLVVEADRNGLDLEEYVSRLRSGRDLDGFVFLDPDLVVHHEDEDIRNNVLANLRVTTHEEHAREHGDAEHFGHGVVGYLRVVDAMAEPRLERTYDLTMAEATPSYVANGMVVHNTGKTVTAIVAAKMRLAMRDPEDPTKPHPDAPRKVLIVAPLNTVEQWRQAAEGFDDGADMIGSGSQDIPAKAYVAGVQSGRFTNQLAIVGPEYWTLHQNTLRAAGFDGLMVDEAHMGLKNDKAERNRALHGWNPDMKMLLLLTGTPMTTSPADFMEYIKILSKGEHFAGMTRKQFEDEYLEESPVPTDLGVMGGKGPKTHVKPEKRDELAAMIARWTHIAAPKDVRGKTLPAVRIEESKHAHMTGIQSQLYALRMAALSDADRDALAQGSGLAEDELAGLDNEARKEVSAAKAIANCPAYKPASNEQFVPTYDLIPDRTGKVAKKRTDFTTFDPEQLVGKGRGKGAGRWPSIEEIGEHRAALYSMHFGDLVNQNYAAVAGQKITEEQLAKMRALGWPTKVRNPEAGPLGVRCRGSDEQGPPHPDADLAATVQRAFGLAFKSGIPGTNKQGKQALVKPSVEQALTHVANGLGLDEDHVRELLSVRPGPSIVHKPTVAYGGVTVHEGEGWVSDTRGSLHLLYRRDDWDEEAARPKSADLDKARAGQAVTLEGEKDADAAWRFVGHTEDGKVEVQRVDTGEHRVVPREKVTAQVRSLMDPGMRDERAKADVAMVVGNAKAEELMAHIARFHQDTGPGPDGERQMVLFGNGILESCRTMEAALRLQGFRDVNEAIEGSPHYDPSDPGPSPNGKYFVTYIGGTYTGDRELNVAVFQKVKDKLGRDGKRSLLVDKCLNGRSWLRYDAAGDVAKDRKIKLSQWTPEQRDRIRQQFGITPPEAHIIGEDGTARFFYGDKKSRAKLREIVLAGDPKAMMAAAAAEPDPEKAEEGRKRAAAAVQKIAGLQGEYEAMVRAGATNDPPLSPRQEHVFNNTEMIVCSDAAQVGMNLGNAVEMVMYDSLGSPMAEWQRITRCARMLPPAVADRLKEPFARIKALEPAMFAATGAAGPEGLVRGLKIASSEGGDKGDLTLGQALDSVSRTASAMAQMTRGDDSDRWSSIAAKARVARNLGSNQAVSALRELAATTRPGGTETVISFSGVQHRDPEAGTYGQVQANEAMGAVRKACDSVLTEDDRTAIADAGFGGRGGLDPASIYLAVRAQDILERIDKRRPELAAQMRSSGAGTVVTDSDVMNAVIDELSPEDRAVLKTKKYLVNVRRLGVSADVPQMVTVVEGEGDDKVKRQVFTGYEREYPIKPEQRTRATQRARMVSNESLMRSIQDGVAVKTELDYETLSASDAASISRADVQKARTPVRLGVRFANA